MQPPSFKKRKLSPPPSSFKDQAYSRLDWQSSIEGTGTDGGVEAYHGGRKIVGRKRNAITSLANATYNSDMFKLRIDELLAKMRPNCGRNTVEAENALRKLKSIIEQIPDREAIPVGSDSKLIFSLRLINRYPKQSASNMTPTRSEYRFPNPSRIKRPSTLWHTPGLRTSTLLEAMHGKLLSGSVIRWRSISLSPCHQ